MEEFEQPFVVAGLGHRRYGGVVENGVGFGGRREQFVGTDPSLDEGVDDPRRDLGVAQTPHRAQRVRVEPGPGLRQVETAVGRQALEQDVLEVENRRTAARADVAHDRPG